MKTIYTFRHCRVFTKQLHIAHAWRVIQFLIANGVSRLGRRDFPLMMKTDNSAFFFEKKQNKTKQNKTITATDIESENSQLNTLKIQMSSKSYFKLDEITPIFFFTERNCNLLRMVYLALLEKFSFYLTDCSQVSCCNHISQCE